MLFHNWREIFNFPRITHVHIFALIWEHHATAAEIRSWYVSVWNQGGWWWVSCRARKGWEGERCPYIQNLTFLLAIFHRQMTWLQGFQDFTPKSVLYTVRFARDRFSCTVLPILAWFFAEISSAISESASKNSHQCIPTHNMVWSLTIRMPRTTRVTMCICMLPASPCIAIRSQACSIRTDTHLSSRTTWVPTTYTPQFRSSRRPTSSLAMNTTKRLLAK